MKQDEIRNEILPHCLNGSHADLASEKIMNLLSKQKPSERISESELIAKMKAYKFDNTENIYFEMDDVLKIIRERNTLTPPFAEIGLLEWVAKNKFKYNFQDESWHS